RGGQRLIASDESACATQLGHNPEIDSGKVRYLYTSLTTPASTYDFDVVTGTRTLLKREPVLGDFSPELYATELLWAPARDGTRVPVSVAYRRDRFRRDGSAPLLQYAYGSYGISSDPRFSIPVLPLLDPGFVYYNAFIIRGYDIVPCWYCRGNLTEK